MNTNILYKISLLIMMLLGSQVALASGAAAPLNLHMTSSTAGLLALVIFVMAYLIVMVEEFTHLRKSKPVILAGGLIWIIVGMLATTVGMSHEAEVAVRHNILEFAELFLFLLVAMTYVNTMEERNVFEALRSWLVSRGFSYRKLFWITGILSFFISPIADNLTTALLMCAVVMAVGVNSPKFIALSCINIVVAANAGGAFSPFGDITTLMVWQKGLVEFHEFFAIFIPSVVSYVVPAACMHFAVPNERPAVTGEIVRMKHGARRVVVLFLITIVCAVSFHNFLHLPPMLGMMTGLALLQLFGYYLKRVEHMSNGSNEPSFDIFRKIAGAEWDTLLFFFGLIIAVGGLATIGYLELTSTYLYQELGASLSDAHKATPANIAVGVLSAIVDNIPVMFAVLTMNPDMSHGQWLLVTLTAGIGGSMLSIGSAAGVALMGKARGYYTFFSHLKWTWAIAMGYVLGIYSHILINADLF